MTNNTKVEKVTKAQKLGMLIELLENSEDENKQLLIDFCNHEIELLEKKKTSKASKANEEHETIKRAILEVLAGADKPMRIIEMTKANEILAECSNQKISAMLRKLGEKGTGEVERVEEKKVAYFKLA